MALQSLRDWLNIINVFPDDAVIQTCIKQKVDVNSIRTLDKIDFGELGFTIGDRGLIMKAIHPDPQGR